MISSKSQGKEIIICKQYKLGQKLGKGAFGEIFKCQHIRTKKEYAVKLERRDNKFP